MKQLNNKKIISINYIICKICLFINVAHREMLNTKYDPRGKKVTDSWQY